MASRTAAKDARDQPPAAAANTSARGDVLLELSVLRATYSFPPVLNLSAGVGSRVPFLILSVPASCPPGVAANVLTVPPSERKHTDWRWTPRRGNSCCSL